MKRKNKFNCPQICWHKKQNDFLTQEKIGKIWYVLFTTNEILQKDFSKYERHKNTKENSIKFFKIQKNVFIFKSYIDELF